MRKSAASARSQSVCRRHGASPGTKTQTLISRRYFRSAAPSGLTAPEDQSSVTIRKHAMLGGDTLFRWHGVNHGPTTQSAHSNDNVRPALDRSKFQSIEESPQASRSKPLAQVHDAPNRTRYSVKRQEVPRVKGAHSLQNQKITASLADLLLGSRDLDRGLEVQYGPDSGVRIFDPIFLRDSCRCAHCVDQHSGQKKFNTTDIPPNIHMDTVEQDSEGHIQIVWKPDIAGFADGHTTTLSRQWLVAQQHKKERLPLDHRQKTWAKEDMDKRCPKVDFERYMEDESAFQEALFLLRIFGLLFVKNVPSDEAAVERIGERIGPLRHTFYGRTWDVKDKPRAENVAYTSGHLGLHMDLLYMKNPPGFQLLHCIKAAGTGGESIFSDALRAADTIYSIDRYSFAQLTKFPVTYEYKVGGHHFLDDKPVFEMSPYFPSDDKKSPVPVFLNTNWSPPFQGNFRVDVGHEDQSRGLRDWHRAARAFDIAINAPENLYRYRMEEGDCVIFNNRRVLHGRTAFTSDATETRFLKGAYLDGDDFWSHIRVMEEKNSERKSLMKQDEKTGAQQEKQQSQQKNRQAEPLTFDQITAKEEAESTRRRQESNRSQEDEQESGQEANSANAKGESEFARHDNQSARELSMDELASRLAQGKASNKEEFRTESAREFFEERPMQTAQDGSEVADSADSGITEAEAEDMKLKNLTLAEFMQQREK